jgi:TonB family protein
MAEELEIVRASPAGAAISNALVREMRGSFFNGIELRFLLFIVVSGALHGGIMFYLSHIKIESRGIVDIEKIPERFARLIIEKPIPKTPVKKAKTQATPNEGATAAKSAVTPNETKAATTGAAASKTTPVEQAHARKAVAARTARVEQMVRSVGVLGMLTGVGATAKGPAVVDVLGAMGTRKESTGNLEDALSKMTGLRRTENVEVLQQKLVKSKDVAIEHKQEIDDLIASVGTARSVDLVKKGEFVIQRPESIEGAASSNAKRDNGAINTVVASHKASLRMSYEKFLKRDPALAGKITVRFTIGASGTVSAVTILENSTSNTELEHEILSKIRMWQFEAIPEGDVTVTYPFVFMPAT